MSNSIMVRNYSVLCNSLATRVTLQRLNMRTKYSKKNKCTADLADGTGSVASALTKESSTDQLEISIY